MKKHILYILLLCVLASCYTKKKESIQNTNAAVKAAVMETDREFSKYSEVRGLRAAFTEYIDSNGILLRPNTVPLVEGNAMDFISMADDKDFIMTWEPKSATVSISGDLAFTYGIYSMKPGNSDSVQYGTYVTIWKKQDSGKWKFILHSGNEGVGESVEE
jgi:ketosteroid isomerase-like protein